MWQHLANILFGLVLIIVALISVGVGALMPGLALTFGLIGVAVSLISLGGFFGGLAKQPQTDFDA